MRKYNYDKLPSSTAIRLVHLAAGGSGAPLRSHIVTTTLEAGTVYEAVSYVWGDEIDKEPIQVGKNRQLFITKNLAAALLRFRDPSSVRTLWIDSISIDQGNTEEKKTQVPLMGRIFREASRVLIWLGEGPDLETAAKLNNCVERLNAAYPLIFDLSVTDPKFNDLLPKNHKLTELFGFKRPCHDRLHQILNLPVLNSAGFQALLELMRSPWFFRAWTWQEQFVARESILHWGESMWDSTELAMACISVVRIREFTGLALEYGNEGGNALTMLLDEELKETVDFGELLKVRKGADCKYPHDLLYSLLGAGWDCPDIPIDYEQPFETLFARFTWQFMYQQGELSILRQVEREYQSSDLPTWVPDWRVKLIGSYDAPLTISGDFRYRATGSSRMTGSLSSDCKIMSLSGICWDSIKAVHLCNERGLVQWLSVMFASSEQLEKLYSPTNESLDRALHRVWYLDTLDFMGGDKPTRWQPDSHDKYDEINRNYSLNEEAAIKHGKSITAFVRIGHGRSVFVTKGGKLGMAADTIQPGDNIALLLGGDLLCARLYGWRRPHRGQRGRGSSMETNR
jgi:hypothetical protein